LKLAWVMVDVRSGVCSMDIEKAFE
jgi:hypothetical protein